MGGDTPPAPQNNPGKDLQKYVQGLTTALPSVFGLESQYRNQFGGLNLGDIGGLLNGTGGQMGLIGMGGQANAASQQQLEAARSAEFQNMIGNAGSVRNVLSAASPGSRSLADQQTQLASNAYARANGPLSFEDRRTADQTARESFATRGRLNDNASVVGEILGREDMSRARRQEASQLGQQAFNTEQQFSQPALQLLGGSPASVLLGQDYLNSGKQAVGSNVPQLIDTGAGITLGQQNSANLANWQSSVASAKNAQAANTTSAIGSAVGAIASIAAAFSDKRLKKDVKKVGKTNDGLPIYTYKMIGSPKTQMGVMAQDVKKKKPKAMGPLIGGYHTVDYSKV